MRMVVMMLAIIIMTVTMVMMMLVIIMLMVKTTMSISEITLFPELSPLETACWWMCRAASLKAISYFNSGANRSWI